MLTARDDIPYCFPTFFFNVPRPCGMYTSLTTWLTCSWSNLPFRPTAVLTELARLDCTGVLCTATWADSSCAGLWRLSAPLSSFHSRRSSCRSRRSSYCSRRSSYCSRRSSFHSSKRNDTLDSVSSATENIAFSLISRECATRLSPSEFETIFETSLEYYRENPVGFLIKEPGVKKIL